MVRLLSSATAICVSGTLYFASADRLSLCHCNWPSNHNDAFFPGVQTRGSGRSHPGTLPDRNGNQKADYRQTQIWPVFELQMSEVVNVWSVWCYSTLQRREQ